MPDLNVDNDPSIYRVRLIGREPLHLDGTRLIIEMQEAGLVGDGATVSAEAVAAIVRSIGRVDGKEPVNDSWSATELYTIAAKVLQHMEQLGNAPGTRQTSQPATA